MPKFGTIHFDQALSNLSVGYKNGELVAERVFGRVPVEKQSDRYFIHSRENFRVREDLRAPGDEAKVSRWALSDAPYFCDGHALKDYVPRENSVDADPQLDLLNDTTEVLTDQVLLGQEAGLVAVLLAGMTGTSLASQVATPWSNNANDPVALIRAQAAVIAMRTGKWPNQFVPSLSVWNAIQGNTNVTGRINGAQKLADALVTPAQFASLIEVDEVVVAKAVQTTSAEGQAITMALVWANNALLQYKAPTPGRKTLSLGYTFTWDKAFGVGQPQFVNRYFWQPRLADCVEVHKYYDNRIVAVDAGVLFTNCHP
ncbi:MAG TPA: hypothetical protein VN442_18445 [Bryobacteraceae bacterium]|nr:hypothetical protein [Bryobacteraceae bacterium]